MTQRFTLPTALARLATGTTALFLGVIGLLATSIVPARADVPYNSATHVYMNFSISASRSQATQYTQLISSLRQAAGHVFRGGVLQTQQPYNDSLIRLTLSDTHANLTLWLTPYDLYVRGYTTAAGNTFEFNDSDFSLRSTLGHMGLADPSSVHTLPYSSNYNAMTQAAARGREQMPISFSDFYNSAYNLAFADSPYGGTAQQNSARSLMLMIQLTSEAARFNDVFGIGSDIMGNSGRHYDGLPMLQQRLENSWWAISNYGYQVSVDPATPPANITGVSTLYSWSDVARYVAILLGNMNLPQEGSTGNWGKTEL
ncbi:ribosome-inactivating family protein [Streptomyces sp. FR-108]|uniref:ribosome-inactivating family protein n=1 Tax=Streptomyces sp. FR-108 TaxID=3416665 RepID=UPI003CF3870D